MASVNDAARITLRVVNTGGPQVAVETPARNGDDGDTVFIPPGLCKNMRCNAGDDVRVHAMGEHAAASAADTLCISHVPMTAPEPSVRIGNFVVHRDSEFVRVAHGPPVRMYVSVDMSTAHIGVAPLSIRASTWAAPPLTRDGATRTPPDKRGLDTSAGMMATACLVGREFLLEHEGEVFAVPTAPTTYAYQLDNGSFLYLHVAVASDRVGDGARTLDVSVTYTGELVFVPQYF